eukprot:27594-Alexandrium_andersonii.AAC.1
MRPHWLQVECISSTHEDQTKPDSKQQTSRGEKPKAHILKRPSARTGEPEETASYHQPSVQIQILSQCAHLPVQRHCSSDIPVASTCAHLVEASLSVHQAHLHSSQPVTTAVPVLHHCPCVPPPNHTRISARTHSHSLTTQEGVAKKKAPMEDDDDIDGEPASGIDDGEAERGGATRARSSD